MSDEYREIKEMYEGREATDRHPSSLTIDPSQDDEMTTAPIYDNGNNFVQEQ